MLILEGSDLVGKTTLAKQLTKRLWDARMPHVYSHFSRLPDAFDRYWGYVERASRDVVQDRYHMSEIAYGVGRGDLGRLGDNTLTPERYRLVDAHIRAMGAYTVVLYSSEPQLLRDRYEREQAREMYDIDLVLRVNAWYEGVSDHLGRWVPSDAIQPYDMDVDWAIDVALMHDWPSLECSIVNRYLERRQACERYALRA